MSRWDDDEPIRWGILGAGRVADGFATGLQSVPGAMLVAVASRRRATAEAFAARHGRVHVHDDAQALVDDPSVDVVYVATPNDRHAEDSVLCLSRGKPVLCEKPFALNATEARRVVDEARAHGLFCMEAMWMRFIPAIQELTELVRSGVIGDVVGLHADFSIAASFDPTDRLFDPARGGGALLDLGVYTVSLADLLLGPPTDVIGRAVLGPSGVDEHSAALLSYASGELAVLTSSISAAGANGATVLGREGTIHLLGPICCPTRLVIRRQPLDGGNATPSRMARVIGSSRSVARLRRVLRGMPGLARNRQIVRRPINGNGYNYEADEVCRRLRAGDLESPLMPLDTTVRVLEQLDAIRSQWPSP